MIPLVDIRIEAFDSFSTDIESRTAAVLVFQNNELEAVFKTVQYEVVRRLLLELETQYFLKTISESLWNLSEQLTVVSFSLSQLQSP